MLFARFHHIYTHKYDSAYSDTQTLNYAKKEWALSLRDFNQKQIEWAIEQCKDKFAWPPSISEFKALIQPSSQQMGLPSTRNAYVEACLGSHQPVTFQWSHPVIRHAANVTDFFSLKSQPESYMLPIFKKNYEKACEQFFKDEPFEKSPIKTISNTTRQADSVDLIELKIKQHPDIDPSIISKLYYYGLKTQGTAARASFRDQAIKKANTLKLELQFPE
ncbi:hypothetical protein TYM08_P2115 [Marinicellulosiphila megalodicopiae]